MADVPREQLTRSSQINTVLKEAQAFCEEGAEPKFLFAAAEAAERFVAHMQTVYRAQIFFREKTPLMVEQVAILSRAFKDLREILGRLKAQTPTPQAVREQVERVRTIFEKLMGAVDALQKEEESMPLYSRSPFMNRVMRVATGWSRGLIDADALRDTLDEMLGLHRKFASSIDRMPRQGTEVEIFERRRDEIRSSIARIEKGLLEAQALLPVGGCTRLMAALKEACDATEQLLSVQDEFREAEEARRLRPCFRCGTRNPRAQRHCGKCGAFMPPVALDGEDVSSVDLQVEDQVRASGHVRTEMTERLSNAAAQVQQGKMALPAFEAVLDEATRRLEQARKEFERLGTPPETASDEKAILDQAAELLKTGLDDVDEGLRKMRVFLIDGNPAHLDLGLETALKGSDRMFAVQVAAQATKGAHS